MRKTTNRCDVISKTPVSSITIYYNAVLEEVCRSNFFEFLSVIKHCTASQLWQQIIMSLSETEVI